MFPIFTVIAIVLGALTFTAVPVVATLLWTMPIAKSVYEEQLVRTSPVKWRRENSCPTDAEYSEMYSEAEEWGKRYEAETTEVTVKSDGLRLCGRFTDFGSEKTVIILCGRAEGCIYSYHYAEPYRRAGYNILVIDQRAHGDSEGTKSGIGYLEQRDVLQWMRLLEKEHHTGHIVLHGACIGAACAVYTAANRRCPATLKGIVTDGLYRSFHDVFHARFHTNKRPIFPVLYEIEWLIKKHIGVDIKRQGPIAYIGRVKVPVLFIHSKEDVSSIPENVPELYDACNAPKKLVWMEHGVHSHLRKANTEQYDRIVTEFAESLA